MAKVAKVVDIAATGSSATSIRDRVVSSLAKQILSGHFPQGSLLPTETELGAAYKVSRTALREAVRTLAAKGLLESRQRAGTRVCQSEDWNRLDADVLHWMSEVEPDLDFVRGLTEARQIIEPAGAEMAAKRATSRNLAAIEEAYDAMCSAKLTDLDACARADVAFHVAILHASRNPVLANLGNVIGAALQNAFRLTTSASLNYKKTLAAHGEVLEAIRMRQPDVARSRMQALLGIATEDLMRLAEAGSTDGKRAAKRGL